uniref:DOG1 domain-containing protein n=1 Tax=Oryza barthii TaxID=65489 RepID=A0A0D3GWW9_9ORYZ
MVVAPPPLTEPKFESQLALPLQHGDDQDDAAALQESPRHASDSFEQEASKPRDKIQRRLAQNREAARKSRLRKKAYIQNLETSRMKLAHLEQEITRARQQSAYINRSSNPATLPAPIDSGVVTFEVEYAQWVEEQGRQTAELRAALQAAAEGPELRAVVEAALAHYDRLFAAKREAARRDVFFVMSGVWRTGAERFFLWIAGLSNLVAFVDHADHLRQETLQNMYKILTLPQAARGLLALGDYCQRLRALSSLWAARPREPA